MAQWDKSVGSSCPRQALFALHKQRDYSEKGLSAANKQGYHTHTHLNTHAHTVTYESHMHAHTERDRKREAYKDVNAHTNTDKHMQTNVHSNTTLTQ